VSARELRAVARGRLVWLRLPADPVAAEVALRRAAAAVDAPLVTALGGGRPSSLDLLVAEHDLVVVAADPVTPLARAALDRLSHRCVAAIACRPLPRGPARSMALAGLKAPRLEPPLRATATDPAT
jgi:hypothetical protein